MLDYLIPAPDMPWCQPTGCVFLDESAMKELLGKPNANLPDDDPTLTWSFVGPGGGAFQVYNMTEMTTAWWISFPDDDVYHKENRELATRVFGEALELEDGS